MPWLPNPTARPPSTYSPFEDLPNELIDHIVSYVPWYDLLAVLRVNHRIYAIALRYFEPALVLNSARLLQLPLNKLLLNPSIMAEENKGGLDSPQEAWMDFHKYQLFKRWLIDADDVQRKSVMNKGAGRYVSRLYRETEPPIKTFNFTLTQIPGYIRITQGISSIMSGVGRYVKPIDHDVKERLRLVFATAILIGLGEKIDEEGRHNSRLTLGGPVVAPCLPVLSAVALTNISFVAQGQLSDFESRPRDAYWMTLLPTRSNNRIADTDTLLFFLNFLSHCRNLEHLHLDIADAENTNWSNLGNFQTGPVGGGFDSYASTLVDRSGTIDAAWNLYGYLQLPPVFGIPPNCLQHPCGIFSTILREGCLPKLRTVYWRRRDICPCLFDFAHPGGKEPPTALESFTVDMRQGDLQNTGRGRYLGEARHCNCRCTCTTCLQKHKALTSPVKNDSAPKPKRRCLNPKNPWSESIFGSLQDLRDRIERSRSDDYQRADFKGEVRGYLKPENLWVWTKKRRGRPDPNGIPFVSRTCDAGSGHDEEQHDCCERGSEVPPATTDVLWREQSSPIRIMQRRP